CPIEDFGEEVRCEERRRPSAKVDGDDLFSLELGGLPLPFGAEALHEGRLQMPLIRDDIKVAVWALLRTEGDMEINTYQLSRSGSSRMPRFQRLRSEKGSSSSSSRSVSSSPPPPPSVSSSETVSVSCDSVSMSRPA